MWIILALFALVFFGLLSSLYALAATRVPVVGTPVEYLDEIARAADLHAGDTVADAGCGDGRVLLSLCAAEGVRGVGYELNGPVCLWAILRVLRSGRHVRVRWSDFFRCDLEDVTVLYCFLMPAWLPRVGAKAKEEMRPGSRVLTYLWPIPDWTPERVVHLGRRADPLYLYQVPQATPEALSGAGSDDSASSFPLSSPGPKT